MTNWTEITAKHPGHCIHCGVEIAAGTSVKWCAGRGIQHVDREACTAALLAADLSDESETGDHTMSTFERCPHGAEFGAYCVPCEEAFLAKATADLDAAQRRYKRNPSEQLGDQIDELRKIVGKTQLEISGNKAGQARREYDNTRAAQVAARELREADPHRHGIYVGTKFRAAHADAMPEWTVVGKGRAYGGGQGWDVYVATIEDDPDFAGAFSGFTAEQILAGLPVKASA